MLLMTVSAVMYEQADQREMGNYLTEVMSKHLCLPISTS